jgi:hypothetical protein
MGGEMNRAQRLRRAWRMIGFASLAIMLLTDLPPIAGLEPVWRRGIILCSITTFLCCLVAVVAQDIRSGARSRRQWAVAALVPVAIGIFLLLYLSKL